MEVTKTTKVFSFKQELFCYEKEDKTTKTGTETAQEKTRKNVLKKIWCLSGKMIDFSRKAKRIKTKNKSITLQKRAILKNLPRLHTIWYWRWQYIFDHKYR